MLRLLLLCTVSFPGHAQLRFSSLEEVFGYADQNAVSIQSARDQQLIAASKTRAAKAALLPAVNASAGFNDNITLQPTLVPASLLNPAAPEGIFNEYTFGRKYLYSTGVQASWEVINFQKWFDVKTSRAAQKLSEANTRSARFQVYNQLAQTYYSILLTEKYIAIARGNIAVSDSICRIAEDKYEAGIFTEENLNRSKIQHIQTVQQAGSLSASLAQLYNQFQSQLNTSEQVMLSGELTASQPGSVGEESTAPIHPQVQVQQAQLRLNERQLAQSRAMAYPSLTVGYQFNRNWATDKMFDLSAANNLPQQFWGLKLSIPVFNGLFTREKVTQAQIQLHQQQRVLDNQARVARKEDENLLIQFRQSTEDLKQQEAVLRLQSSSDSHTNDRYESGIIGLDERLDKFQDLLLVQNQYMQSLSNYYVSYYQRYLRIKL
ncbi:outer membrane protein TolC [Dyadobacter sp. BE34]|uniref:Outer membrane protein TolC n=1 Tax=Dyadobacter fermentans TaxID=94254 RepID=A0ABU1R9L6_9BACT|nr:MULTISPECIES: TolC family protein [Dyadobacter]MDR6809630.1 outer membrane protein TolC [Dyadobacter fermentans]MDR7047308.1 outer membrane protein TolC [Dyadobacter sp. BE242]MDR7201544.1 outer membrane protein TolC [Dyadobacter sp. BE34]MDR7219414.1 outer membrane protein TolC [Dyadobacter sp. BE31]MDR7267192.1 outer membrane protein TolC [Dyadobacter sp. BE32]